MGSTLVDFRQISPNQSGKSGQDICYITPHCYVAQASVESMGEWFVTPSAKCSANYGIGSDGRVGQYVDEGCRSWCSSSQYNDERAITIECASNTRHPYEVNAMVWSKLILLCTDICTRYGKKSLIYIPKDEGGTKYIPKPDEMQITLHRWYAAKECPGQYLLDHMPELSKIVTDKLSSGTTPTNPKLYRIQVGAFTVKSNATKMVDAVKAAGVMDAFVTKKDKWYTVQCGAYVSEQNARNEVIRLKSFGIDCFIVEG